MPNGSITDSYATGSVSGNNNVGLLVGVMRNGTITNSYATGSGDDDVVDLVGDNQRGTITNSSTQTVMALKTPTAATGIYSAWDPAVWDFGTENDLPTLRDPLEGIRIRVKVFLEGPLQ